MSSYKVGDLASLVSSTTEKPRSKLQSLFDEHWNKKQKPNAAQYAKEIKTQELVNTAQKLDNKRKKRNSSASSSPIISSLKEKETDYNCDYLPIHNKNKHIKKQKSNFEKKRKRSFSENLAEEINKDNTEQSKKAFIRRAKNKKQNTSEQEGYTDSVKQDSIKDNLFSENTSNLQSKKQKFKKKSYQNSLYAPKSVGTISIKPEFATENLFNESTKSENQSIKEKIKKKTKNLPKNSSNVSKCVSTISNEFGHFLSDTADSENVCSFQTKQQKSKNKSHKKLLNMDVKGQKMESSVGNDLEKSKMDAEKFRLQNIKDLPCTLFVGNLPVSLNRKMLHKLFASFGQIKSVRLRGSVSTKLSIPKKVAEIKSEYHKGLQSHTGFVVFKDEESAKAALSLNGTLIDNHHIVVDFASQAGEKKLYSNDLSVFLGNLPFDIDDESVRSAFEECGEIHAVRIIRDKNTGLGKGFGYIQFQKIKSKDKALALENLEINGRKIRIKPILSEHEKKGGPKKTVLMIRNNVAVKRSKESGNKKSVKKLLKKGKQMHKKKQIARLMGEKFVK